MGSLSVRLRSATIPALLICSALAGCRRDAPEFPLEDRRAEVLETIEHVDLAMLQEAFDRLGNLDHRRSLTVIQEDREGRETARITQVVEFRSGAGTPPEATIARQDTTGRFDFGLFERVVTDEMHILALPDYARHLIPEQPAYLRPRMYEDYVYTFDADTVIDGSRARVARILLRPAASGNHELVEARYYLGDETNDLLAFYQERAYDAFLFTEATRAFFTFTEVDGRRAPRRVDARTELRVPLTARRMFRVEIDYAYGTRGRNER